MKARKGDVMTPFIVEQVETGDIRPVMRLAWKTTERLYPAIFFEQIALNQGEYFRVVRDAATRRVVGFVIAARQPGRQENFLLLAVEPKLLGRGVRRALMADVQRVLRDEGVRQFRVEVPMGDRAQMDFYKDQGFEILGLETASGAPFADRAVLAKSL